MSKTIITTNKIPQSYFMTTGVGQSNEGAGIDHWETCAYDLALLDARIGNFNIIKYTSVIPKDAYEIDIVEAEKYFQHGAVMESIMAQVNGVKGEVICAGVGRMHVSKDGVLIGGFAVEYEGHCSESQAEKYLEQDLQKLFKRRYGDDPFYKIEDMNYTTRSLIVDDNYGTVLVAICFVSYIFPIIGE